MKSYSQVLGVRTSLYERGAEREVWTDSPSHNNTLADKVCLSSPDCFLIVLIVLVVSEEKLLVFLSN